MEQGRRRYEAEILSHVDTYSPCTKDIVCYLFSTLRPAGRKELAGALGIAGYLRGNTDAFDNGLSALYHNKVSKMPVRFENQLYYELDGGSRQALGTLRASGALQKLDMTLQDPPIEEEAAFAILSAYDLLARNNQQQAIFEQMTADFDIAWPFGIIRRTGILRTEALKLKRNQSPSPNLVFDVTKRRNAILWQFSQVLKRLEYPSDDEIMMQLSDELDVTQQILNSLRREKSAGDKRI